FKAAYDAAKLLEGKYSLYTKAWAANNKEAQYQNFVDLFFDDESPENILIKGYHFPETVHGYDAYNVPRQLMGGNGYSSEVNPTLNFVEMFDGFPKNADGTIKTLDAQGEYVLYDNTMDIFADAEPRLRASVILPGDIMKEQSIEIRRGIYTGSSAGGISKLLPANSTANYPTANIVSSSNANQTPYTLPDGSKMNPAGLSGVFTGDGTAAVSGFSVRKYIDPERPTAEVLENRSDQTWIEMRYAEILLNRAEAAYELNAAGQTGNYLQDAFTCINQIRERAGAIKLATAADLDNVDTIRRERRKELAFENKIWWDLKRWRIIDKEQNGTLYRTLMPFYVADAEKYFMDARLDERNSRYTFDTRWYYQQIPGSVISKSPNIIQNPGY
ncbi:MAG: RagB/SusD family nutrient uptake outer membrane protein, partial [Sphingobacteriales bacterium]